VTLLLTADTAHRDSPPVGLRDASADPRGAALPAGPGALPGVTPGPGELRVVGLAEDSDGERGCSGEG